MLQFCLFSHYSFIWAFKNGSGVPHKREVILGVSVACQMPIQHRNQVGRRSICWSMGKLSGLASMKHTDTLPPPGTNGFSLRCELLAWTPSPFMLRFWLSLILCRSNECNQSHCESQVRSNSPAILGNIISRESY